MLTLISQDRWSRRNADHLYHRADFGGSPSERETFYQLGKNSSIEAAVDSLVLRNRNPVKQSQAKLVDRYGPKWRPLGGGKRTSTFIRRVVHEDASRRRTDGRALQKQGAPRPPAKIFSRARSDARRTNHLQWRRYHHSHFQ